MDDVKDSQTESLTAQSLSMVPEDEKPMQEISKDDANMTENPHSDTPKDEIHSEETSDKIIEISQKDSVGDKASHKSDTNDEASIGQPEDNSEPMDIDTLLEQVTGLDSGLELQELKHKVVLLQSELNTKQSELSAAQEQLQTLDKLYKSALSYNLDIKKQLMTITLELMKYRKDSGSVTCTDQTTQTDSFEALVNTGGSSALTNQTQSSSWADWGSTPVHQQEPALDIAQSVKDTAEAAVQQSGYVYDAKTGLYYNYNTGYYYDSAKGLYYEPKSGTYYYYNAESQTYEVHSQITLSQYSTPTTWPSQYSESYRPSHSTGGMYREDTRDLRNRRDRRGDLDYSSRGHSRRDGKRESVDSHYRRKSAERYDEKFTRSKRSRETYYADDKSDYEEKRSSKHARRSHEKKDKKSSEKKERKKEKHRKKRELKEHRTVTVEDSNLDEKGEESKEGGNLKWEESEKDQPMISDDTQGDEPMASITSKKPEDSAEKEKKDEIKVEEIEEQSDEPEESVGELEEGELSTGSGSGDVDDSDLHDDLTGSSCQDEDAEMENVDEAATTNLMNEAASYIPCIRAIVRESEHLQVGGLHIVTCTGGSIGREPSLNHAIHIPDPQVSKMHCELMYDESLQRYTITDKCSQAGTFVNNNRLSDAKKESAPQVLYNGDSLRIGSTTFNLHIHPGTTTCDECEPGLIKTQSDTSVATTMSSADREKQRRKELKNIKKKFGLENTSYEDDSKALDNPLYKDKAGERRRTKGSDNPYQRDDLPASVNRAISEENKGHKLLSKMGWKEGDSLGKSQAGITEPINVNVRAKSSAGLGAYTAYDHSLDAPQNTRKTETWIKTQERYHKLNAPATEEGASGENDV